MSSDARWYELTPADAWFFRDGYPFNAGEDQGARETIFPPYPPTVVGAIRAALARSRGWNGHGPWNGALTPVLGDGDDLGALSFRGPFLCKDGELLFVMPRHVAGHVEDGVFKPKTFLVPGEVMTTDAGEVQFPALPPEFRGIKTAVPKHPEGYFVTASGMSRILQGERPMPDECVPAKALYRIEERIGIKRDEKKHTTGEASMYAPRHVRLMEGVSLAVLVTGVPSDWAIPPLFPMGGESRLAACAAINPPPSFPPKAPAGGKCLRIALTPCRFTGQSWWGAGPGDAASALSEGLSGRVVSAAIDRPLGIGGWDFKRKGPRSMLPHVAPGAVWWLENSEDSAAHRMLGECTEYGFGMTLTGVWAGKQQREGEQ